MFCMPGTKKYKAANATVQLCNNFYITVGFKL